MATVWFAPPSREEWKLPFQDAVEILKLSKRRRLDGPPALPDGPPFGRNQRVLVEVAQDEVRGMPGWPAGFFESERDAKVALDQLRTAGFGKELGFANQVR